MRSDAKTARRHPFGQFVSSRLFLASILVCAICYLRIIFYSHFVTGQIEIAATRISGDDAPSIIHLAKARADLRQMEALVIAYVSFPTARDRAIWRKEIAQAHSDMDQEITSFTRLPTSPAELLGLKLARSAMFRLNALLGRIYSLTDHGFNRQASELVRRQFPVAVTNLSNVIIHVIDVDADDASLMARRITTLRARADHVRSLVEIATIVFTFFAIYSVIKIGRDRIAIFEEENRSLESRSRELELFSGRVAHDILGPLTATSLALEMVTRRIQESDPLLARLAREGSSSLQSVRQIVSELLDFARSAGVPALDSSTEVGAILSQVLEQWEERARNAGVSVQANTFQECWVRCGPGILTSIISNLLGNAIKYTRTSARREVRINVEPQATRVRIEVSDTGSGIPEQNLGSIFEPYFRVPGVAEPGLGLGLAKVSRLVNAHGGRLTMHSKLGKGSTFCVELPRGRQTGTRAAQLAG